MSFSELGLNSSLTRAVKEAGYTEPTPVQSKTIPVTLSGKDVIGIAQTGTGKTAAFVLPILQRLSEKQPAGRGIRALIVAPTRELVVQIEENARNYGRHLRLRIATIYGGVGEGPQISALRSGVEIIIATPGRLLDLMQQGHVKFQGVETLVLDEADRMLDMGFLPAIKQIVRALPTDRQTLLFSATFSKEIEALSGSFLRSPQVVQIGKRANPAESVEQTVYEVPKSRKIQLLLHLLGDASMDSVLVFSRTKHGADKIARKLSSTGITTGTLHSNRSQNQRIQALRSFRSGAVRVLVATDIAARGIDVEGISHVINFDFPPQPEDYVHRIGRTGRAKAVGDAISFVTADDNAALRALEKFIGRGIPRKRATDFDYTAAPDAEDYSPRPAQRPNTPRHTSRPGQTSSRPGQTSSRPGQTSSRRPAARPSSPSRPSAHSRPAAPSSKDTGAPAGKRRTRW
jgi:ATP-dependent RNA helicase RhlE